MNRAFVEANPNTTAAIQCALLEANAFVKDNREYYEDTLVTELGATEEGAHVASETMEAFVTADEYTIESVQSLMDLLYEVGDYSEPLDVAEHAIPLPESCS
jgi:ABC-type nitrate/sulfonate/bicarbonate transport system substrate-binding protein